MTAARDLQLARGLARDVDAGFPDVVRAYQDRLFAFALGMLGNPADAEETAQEAFLHAHRALRRYPSERVAALRLNAWLHRITLNLVRNRIRRRPPDSVAIVDLRLAAPGETPEDISGRLSDRQRLLRCLASLPPARRIAVLLRHAEDLSYAQVAAVTGRPVGSVKADVHRGLEQLRRDFEEEDRRWKIAN